jgi:hypothetical protein
MLSQIHLKIRPTRIRVLIPMMTKSALIAWISVHLLLHILMFHNDSQASEPVTGRVTEPFAGVAFTVPQGWSAWKTDIGYVMGSDHHKGFILVMQHQYNSVAELMQAAAEPILDDSGTMLQQKSAPEKYGESGISAHYTGFVEWQQAKAFVIGLISPFGGGVTILTAVEPATFSDQYPERVRKIADGITFTEPEVPPIVDQLKQDLAGIRLTYMHSYTSGLTGGYRDHIEIHLCHDRAFGYSDKSSVSVNVDGGYGFGHGSGGGSGAWDVISVNGQPALQLNFHSGEQKIYHIAIQGNDLYLENRRYFRTRDALCH